MIAPSHGVIWRSYVKEIIEDYHRFADGISEDTALGKNQLYSVKTAVNRA